MVRVVYTTRRNMCYRMLRYMLMASILPFACCGGEADTISMHQYLSEMGQKFDCYFTVESIGTEGILNNQILDAPVKVDTNGVQSLDALIAFLTNNLVVEWKWTNETNRISIAVDVHRVEGRKPVVRLRDRRLASVTNYALDRYVGLEYVGPPDALL